jgi:hypothetical protein
MKPFLGVLLAFACVSEIYAGSVDRPDAERRPVLLELFTSEGCSSCPPVDVLVKKMDAEQPFPGVQLIVLGEHVDYWNHDGWKDPYSSSLPTDRQTAYVRALKLDEPYTPQVIVDGTAVVRSYDPNQLAQIFEKAAATPKILIKIASLSIDGANSPVLKGRVEASADSAAHNADVYLALALDHAESQVSAGENNGRRLVHVAVMESLKKLGRLESGKSFSQDCQIKLKKGTETENLRVIAFIQEPGPGQVLGAVMEKPAAKAGVTP